MKPLKDLNEAERALLRQSWDIIKRDMEKIAVKIFEMIFEQAPEAKQMFPFMKMDYAENEKPKDEFTFHALRFIQVLESVIWTVDDVDNLDPILSNLGKLHARLEEQLGFKTYYWSVFRECTLHHFRRCIKAFTVSSRPAKSDMHVFTEGELDTVIILWRIVIDDVVNKMKSSFYDNVKHRKANRECIDEEHQHQANGERSTSYAGRGKSSVQERQNVTNGLNGNSLHPEQGKTETNGVYSNGATPTSARIQSPIAWIRRRMHSSSPKPERSPKMAIDIELMKIFAKSRRLRRLLMPTMFCALLVAVCLIRQLGFGSHEVRCDEKIESPQSEERQAMNDKTVSDTNSNEDQPQLLSDSIDVVSTKNDFEKVTESNLKANGLINLDVPSRRKVFRRKNMQTCEPVYGRIMVFTAMDDKSINVRYGFAQRSLECYLASTNYTFIQVNLDTDRRIQDHCKHKTAYFKKHCAAAYYLQDTDWMLILDADTGVVNPNHCLEEYIDDRVDMIFYERFFNWEIACGNYIVKNTAQSRQFLMEYANMESEPYKPGTWLGFDNGPLQILILKHVMPFAHHITNICNQIWHNSKNYDQYTAYLLCVKMALGEQRLWPGKVRIYKRAHAWVRDAWLSSDDWTDIDFMFHGWKIENLKEAKGYVSPFTQDFNVTECGRGYSGWHYNLDKKKTIQEMRTVFSNFEKERAKSHPKEGRTPYFLTVPDVGECYPHCEDL